MTMKNIREQLISKLLLKMLPSHLVMVVACALLGLKDEGGIGDSTHLTSCTKNNQTLLLT